MVNTAINDFIRVIVGLKAVMHKVQYISPLKEKFRFYGTDF